MNRVLRLAFAFLREHPVRFFVTALATIAAAAMVVWTVSSYDALLDSFESYSDQSQGRYTLSVAPISTFRQYAPGAIPSTAEKFVPPEIVRQLAADPAVLAADPVWVRRIQMRPAKEAPAGPPAAAVAGKPAGAAADRAPARPAPRRMPEIRLLGTSAAKAPYPLDGGHWLDPARPDLPEAALSSEAAQQFGVGVGDDVVVGEGARARTLRVVGLVANPVIAGFGAGVAAAQVMTPALGGLYVPMALAEELLGEPARIHFVGVVVDPAADVNVFRYGWTPRLGGAATPVQFQEAHDIEETLDQSASAENVRTQAYTATGIALLAALFLVFSTLNMGVAERIRQFAVLRAVALTRLQIGALVAIESFVFATVGFLGGIAVGHVVVQTVARASAQLFRGNGASVGPHSLALAAVCTYGGALLAAIWPILRATRVRPMDAMAPRSDGPARRLSPALVALGLLLLAVQPLVTFAMPMPDSARYAAYVLVGCPAFGLAFILLAPAAVVLVDRFGSPLLARVLGLPPRLLASQITAHLWRTAGIALALTIGLGLYVSIQVWGYSMLNSFMPGAWAPDALVAFQPGLAPDQAEAVSRIPGIVPGHALPIVFEQPRLKDDLTLSAERATVTRQDTLVIVGIDPVRAFGGEDPLFRFEWTAGSPEEAIPLLAGGRGCIVPDHFLTAANLKVGDTFELVPPEHPEAPVAYVVAGAVRLPGWHWQTKPVGFRSRTHRACALVFASYDAVAADFSRPAASHVWLDFDPAATSAEKLGHDARALYAGLLGRDVALGDAPPGAPAVRVMPIDGIRGMVRSHAKQWLWGMSRLPLVTLAITCLGVLNALLASVRARRWDIGVLRAIGFTRWAIVRAVVAEGLLIGLVACLLSLGFGILAGWCGAGLSQYVSFFAGMPLELILEWRPILAGLGAALLLCALAAIGPAVAIGRTEPLALLQQGRGAF